MSGSEGKAEVQLPPPPFPHSPGFAVSLNSSSAATPPFLQQQFPIWPRVNTIEHFPKPFQRDRLPRLPPTVSTADISRRGSGIQVKKMDETWFTLEVDPVQKVQQLERSLAFVKEQHALTLQCLHEEVEELKRKNRELQFQLSMGISTAAQVSQNNAEKGKQESDVLPDAQQKVDRLEKEVRKLRSALREALKVNGNLNTQLEVLKREHDSSNENVHNGRRSSAQSSQNSHQDRVHDGHHRVPTPCGPSPKIDEYSDTLRQIQRAASHPKINKHFQDGRNLDRNGGGGGGGGNEWKNFPDNRRRQFDPQQPRLPRLPLRSQRYEVQYRQRSANVLPALKQHQQQQHVIPIMNNSGSSNNHHSKPRKPRGHPREARSENIPHH